MDDNNDLLEVKALTDDELLSLYDMVQAHLKYLKEKIVVIDDSEDGGEVVDEQN